MKNQPDLLIATGNPGKVSEMNALFRDAPFTLRSLQDFRSINEVDETGSTFEENALMKARGYAWQTGLWALADDSGLEIAALGDAPGVSSARYGGEETSFSQKMSMLLREMEMAADRRRDARFVCSMVLVNRAGDILSKAQGVCEGVIADSPRGNGGFGYDPMFVPKGHEKTFGELSAEIKGEISHRALASRTIIRYLLAFTAL